MQFVRTQVALPKTARTTNPNAKTRESKYDFASMKIGDSDLTNDFGDDDKKAIARVSSAIANYKRKSGDKRRFAVRVYFNDDLQQKVLGVWCLAAKEPKQTGQAVTADASAAPQEAQADLVIQAEAVEAPVPEQAAE